VTASGSPPPVGPYSPAVRAGDFLFCSGQLGLRDGALVAGGTGAQLSVAIERLGAILAEHGATYIDLVKTTVFLVDMDDYAEMNAAYVDGLAGARPARAAIGVAALPMGARVEIEGIAYLPESAR
jgi:2-iminobutanoate/2-iminopropanoate deaminase